MTCKPPSSARPTAAPAGGFNRVTTRLRKAWAHKAQSHSQSAVVTTSIEGPHHTTRRA